MFGLGTLPDVTVDNTTAAAFEHFTRQYLDLSEDAPGPATPPQLPHPPGDTLTFLRWLADRRTVLFHGSHQPGLPELRPDRHSRDTDPFGDQRAVFATDDPVWAQWFALLNRGPGFRSTRNGAWSLRGVRRRQYLFSVNSDVSDDRVLTDGWLYLLSPDGFRPQPSVAGVCLSGQWVNPRPVRPLACLAVSPADFPFADQIGHPYPRSRSDTHMSIRSATSVRPCRGLR
jgi:hypothetical protein